MLSIRYGGLVFVMICDLGWWLLSLIVIVLILIMSTTLNECIEEWVCGFRACDCKTTKKFGPLCVTIMILQYPIQKNYNKKFPEAVVISLTVTIILGIVQPGASRRSVSRQASTWNLTLTWKWSGTLFSV